LGVCINTHIISKAEKKGTIVQLPETWEWVSIIETISTTGEHIWLTVIFK
ncbi:hypothetical protein HOY80DRAFT_896917, partial [Tuber brumale]